MTHVIEQIRPRSWTDREAQLLYTVPNWIKTKLSVYITSLVDLWSKGNWTVWLVKNWESPSEDNKLYMNREIDSYELIQIDKLYLAEWDSIYGWSADGNISFHISWEEQQNSLYEDYLQSQIDKANYITWDQLVIKNIVRQECCETTP